MSVKFFAPGKIVAWSVSRHRGGKAPDLAAYQEKLLLFARQAMRSKPPIPKEHAVYLKLEFVFAHPKDGRCWFPGAVGDRNRKDTTNLQKAAEDALEGVCYTNDVQVVEIRSHKRHTVGDEEPGTNVEVVELREPKARTGGYRQADRGGHLGPGSKSSAKRPNKEG